MKTLKRMLIVLLFVLANLFVYNVSPATAAYQNTTLQCSSRSGGNWFNGYYHQVRCTGSRFKTNAHKYQAWVVCDRAAWQADVTRYGDWQWNGVYSTAKCDSIGDMGIVRRGYKYT